MRARTRAALAAIISTGSSPDDDVAEVGACGCEIPPVIVTPPPLDTWSRSLIDIIDPAVAAQMLARELATAANQRPRPYQNATNDCLFMQLVSTGAPVTVAAGATTVLTWSPTRGWLDTYYIDLSVLDPATGLSVDPASWLITPPRVADCPQPADTTATRGTFWIAASNCCCGRPFRAVVGRQNADGEGMTSTFTNSGPAPVSVQGAIRGYSYARNLCLTCS